jgi:hypothetical protein
MGLTERELCPNGLKAWCAVTTKPQHDWKFLVKDSIRNRVVTFRLSEAEYEALKSACGEDLNSISSVARRTVLEWADTITARPKVDQRLTEVQQKLDALIDLVLKEKYRDADLP